MSQPYDPYRVPAESQQGRTGANWAAGTEGTTPQGGAAQHPFTAGEPRPYAASGPPPGYPHAYMPPTPPQQNLPQGFSIAALVLGLVGLLISWLTLCIPSILAIIFGHTGLSRANRGTGSGKGMAIAGLVLGYVVIGLVTISIAVFAATAPTPS